MIDSVHRHNTSFAVRGLVVALLLPHHYTFRRTPSPAVNMHAHRRGFTRAVGAGYLTRWVSEFAYMLRLAAITVGISLFVSSAAVACDCRPLNFADSVEHADLVFVARVSSFRALDYVTAQPVEVFKGSPSATLTIQTGQSDCDFFLPPVNPMVGEAYLLYLQQSQGRLTASRCLRSGPAVEKATELGALRVRSKPNAQPGDASDGLSAGSRPPPNGR